jgi:hypothetical protein
MALIFPNPIASGSSNDPIFSITEPTGYTRRTSGSNLMQYKISITTARQITVNRSAFPWLSRYGIVACEYNGTPSASAYSNYFMIIGDNNNPGFKFEMLCGTYQNLPSNTELFFGLRRFASPLADLGIIANSTDAYFNFYSTTMPLASPPIKTPLSIPKGPNTNFLISIDSGKLTTNVKIKQFFDINNIVDIFETTLVNGIDTLNSTYILGAFLYTYSTTNTSGFFLSDIRYTQN